MPDREITAASAAKSLLVVKQYLDQESTHTDGLAKTRIIRQALNNVAVLQQHLETLAE